MILPADLGDDFLATYKGVLAYLNGGEEPESVEDYVVFRKQLYSEFADIQSDLAKYLEPEFFESLSHAVFGRFVFMKKYRKGYAFQNTKNSNFYLAVGLTTPLEEIMPEYSIIETAILTFKGYLVCDGLIASYNTVLGKNYQKSIRDSYWEAHKNNEVISCV